LTLGLAKCHEKKVSLSGGIGILKDLNSRLLQHYS